MTYKTDKFFIATLSRIDGDTYYVALYNADNATIAELPARLSLAYAYSDYPRPEPGEAVKCFYENAQVFIMGPTPYPLSLNTNF